MTRKPRKPVPGPGQRFRLEDVGTPGRPYRARTVKEIERAISRQHQVIRPTTAVGTVRRNPSGMTRKKKR